MWALSSMNQYSHKFRNKELEAQTTKVEQEFFRLLRQKTPTRSEKFISNESQRIMSQAYFPKEEKTRNPPKHKSPNARLIKLKQTTVEHKQTLKKQNSQRYIIHYTPKPGHSFVVEPKAELDYDLARKDLKKFYSKVSK